MDDIMACLAPDAQYARASNDSRLEDEYLAHLANLYIIATVWAETWGEDK